MNDLYFYAKDGYNKIEIKGKSIIYIRHFMRPPFITFSLVASTL